MSLTDSDRLFVEQRRGRKHIGLYVAPALLVLLVVVWAGLFVLAPLAVNPKAIWGAQETGVLTCGSGSLSTYATSAAVLVNVGFALVAAMLVLRIAWGRIERRYLRLLDKSAPEILAGTRRELPAVRQ